MKPNFALTLSFDGIGLLHRVASGWHLVGEVGLDTDNLAEELAVLRRTALQLDSGGLHCKLVIPNEQIRYVALDTPGADDAARAQAARAALDGATPYALEELRIDWAADGARTLVAAVARETLEEAETFATEHRFDPLGFVAIAPDGAFVGEPFFGNCTGAEAAMDRDAEPIRIVGMAHLPSATAATEAATAPPRPFSQPPEGGDAAAKTAGKPGTPPGDSGDVTTDGKARKAPAPVPAFSSRRQAAGDDAGKAVDPKAMARTLVARAKPRLTFGLRGGGGKGKAKPAAKRGQSRAAAKPRAGAGAKPTAPRAGSGKAPAAAPVATPARGSGAAPEVAPPARSVSAGTDSGSGRRSAPPARSARTRLAAAARGLRAPLDGLAGAKTALAERVRRLSHATRAAVTRAGRKTRAGIDHAGKRLAGPDRGAGRPAAPAGDGAAGKRRPATTAAPAAGAGAKARANAPRQDEAEKLTIFGARGQDSPGRAVIGGGRRRTGLIVAGAAMLALAGVGVWAMLALQPGAPGTPADRTATAPTQDQTGNNDIAALTPPPESGTVDETGPAEDTADMATPAPLSLDDAAPSATPPAADTAPDTAADTPAPETQAPPAADDATAPTVAAGQDAGAAEDPADAAISTIPRPEEAAARYAATGIWPAAPDTPAAPGTGSVDSLYIASTDRDIAISDAVALPESATLAPDPRPRPQTTPALPGTRFKLDARGLVAATPEGTISPDGVMVYAGSPPATPPRLRTSDTRARDALRERLSGVRPRARPEGLVEDSDRSQLDATTRTELAGLRPRPRPETIAAQADVAGTAEEADTPATGADATERAVAVSLKPEPRPGDLATETVTRRGGTAVAPAIPTSASVAEQATTRNAMKMRDINLVGVYGKPSSRRALVRLPNGKFTKVEVGDTLDGGRVAAIGERELRYVKGGRNLVLKIPRG